MPLWGNPQSPQSVNSNIYNKALQDKGLLQVKQVIRSETGKWLSPNEIMDQYSLPKTSFFTILQILSFCKSRLKDPAREGVANPFNHILSISPGAYGVSRLYHDLKKRLIKTCPETAFRSWEGILGTPGYAKVILEGWSNVRKYIILYVRSGGSHTFGSSIKQSMALISQAGQRTPLASGHAQNVTLRSQIYGMGCGPAQSHRGSGIRL